jgi:hypothetical protein
MSRMTDFGNLCMLPFQVNEVSQLITAPALSFDITNGT